VPFLIFVLSGPFDFAQGRLLKRCSSTVSLSFDGGTEQNQDQSQRQRTRASALHELSTKVDFTFCHGDGKVE
jgi:hypothetical protein